MVGEKKEVECTSPTLLSSPVFAFLSLIIGFQENLDCVETLSEWSLFGEMVFG